MIPDRPDVQINIVEEYCPTVYIGFLDFSSRQNREFGDNYFVQKIRQVLIDKKLKFSRIKCISRNSLLMSNSYIIKITFDNEEYFSLFKLMIK